MVDHAHSTVVGVFRDSDRAREAIEALKDAGFDSQGIGVLMRNRDETKDMAEETGTHAGSGAATGAIGGGLLGGLAGWLVGIGALAIPGVGPFIAAGAFGTALAGAGIGAGVGAVAGALVGMGIPKEEADWYEGEVKGGSTLVTVKADARYEEARDLLRQFGAYDIHDRSGTDVAAADMTGRTEFTDRSTGTLETDLGRDYQTTGMATESRTDMATESSRGRGTEDEKTMRLREEELRVRKERTQAGEVSLRKEVVSEERTIDVPVTHEEAYIERRQVNRPSDRPIGEAEDETIRMPVHEERAYADKETVVREEINLGKRSVEETQRVSDTVRKEEARVERSGDFDIVGGEGHPTHEHRWVNGRCEVCGATRRQRAA